MKLIHLDKTLPDGRVASFHRVTELVMDAGAAHTVVVVGSWVDQADAARAGKPDATSRVELPDADVGQRGAEVIDRLFALPQWNTGELLDVRSV